MATTNPSVTQLCAQAEAAGPLLALDGARIAAIAAGVRDLAAFGGPIGLRELCTFKYLISGDRQVRE